MIDIDKIIREKQKEVDIKVEENKEYEESLKEDNQDESFKEEKSLNSGL